MGDSYGGKRNDDQDGYQGLLVLEIRGRGHDEIAGGGLRRTGSAQYGPTKQPAWMPVLWTSCDCLPSLS